MKAGFKQIFQNRQLVLSLVFGFILLGTAWYYNYDESISYRPTSIHQWRNSVSASIALNYYYEGEFMHPRTHNMQVDDHTSDITITEFPAIYFFIGKLYKVFGYHEIIYKLVNVLLGFMGLYCLFLLGTRAFKSRIYAFVPPLIIFSSPIYVYYINNYIPDATSLSVALVGLYFFYRYYENGLLKNLLWSMAFLCFAGLLKTPALILYFAIGGLFVLERFLGVSLKKEGYIFKQTWGAVLGMAGAAAIIFAWYAYAKIYTDNHGGVVSLVEIRPIWILSKEYIGEIWIAMSDRFWAGQYHNPTLLLFSLVLIIHNIVFFRRYNKVFSLLTFLTLFGGLAFSIFFYRSMKQHDYYQLNNLLIVVLALFNFFLYLEKNAFKIYTSWISKLVLFATLLFFVISTQKMINNFYYNGWFEQTSRERYNDNFNDITPYLRSLGIDRMDKVYVTPDPSINISLYLMDQKGFTDINRKDVSLKQKVDHFHSRGCQYVISSDEETIEKLQGEIGLSISGQYKNAVIFSFPE